MTIIITIDTRGPFFANDRHSRARTNVARIVGAIALRFDTDGPFDGDITDDDLNMIGKVTVIEDLP